jgi:hypothetical protein
MRKLKPRLRIGRKYRLVKDVGVLPKGVYRLEELADFSASFSVGKERLIHFTLIDISKKHLRRFFHAEKDHTEPTDTGDFAHRYFNRVMMTKSMPEMLKSKQSQPITLVVIDDSIESRYKDMAQQAFGPEVDSGFINRHILQ